MRFEEAYQSFLATHQQLRSGERLRRLEEGQGKAEMMFLEKVWWPLYQNFDYLHPEYEVIDFKDGTRYLDFAYIRSGIKICFEVDGYGPHLKNISRWQFADSLERQNQLIIDNWAVIRFSYDQLVDQPKRCQQTTQQIIGKLLGEELDYIPLNYMEKEIVRFALRSDNFNLSDICELLNLSGKPVRRILRTLVEKKVLSPCSGKNRIHLYKLAQEFKNPFRR